MSDAIGNTQKKQSEAILAAMDRLAEQAGLTVKDDALKREGNSFVIPENMTVREARKFLADYEEAQETYEVFTRTFNCVWNAGLYALQRTLRAFTGSAGLGASVMSFFGMQPPISETITLPPGHPDGPTAKVYTGRINVAVFGDEAWIEAQPVGHEEYGQVFRLGVYAPKKMETRVQVLFALLEETLRTPGGDIYQGQAINGKVMPDFLDLSGFDPSQVVYSEGLESDLDALVWRIVEERETLGERGIPFKRAIVLYGDYGTGKTMTAKATAQKCVENGVTFIQVRAGRDNLEQAMQRARLLQPSVVFFEDVDVVASGDQSDSNAVSKLLDLFDGLDAKNNDVMVILTTNHISKLHKGMMRPGRIDAAIRLGQLDADGVRRLAEIRLGDKLDSHAINWDEVYTAMEGYQPAFVNEALTRADLYHRNGESYSTSDLVGAAQGLRPQWELMAEATEGGQNDRFEAILDSVVRNAVTGGKILDRDGDEVGEYGLRIDAEKESIV